MDAKELRERCIASLHKTNIVSRQQISVFKGYDIAAHCETIKSRLKTLENLVRWLIEIEFEALKAHVLLQVRELNELLNDLFSYLDKMCIQVLITSKASCLNHLLMPFIYGNVLMNSNKRLFFRHYSLFMSPQT